MTSAARKRELELDRRRQRRYRERRRNGVQVVPVDVSYKLIERLIDNGKLIEDEADDPKKIAAALVLAGGNSA